MPSDPTPADDNRLSPTVARDTATGSAERARPAIGDRYELGEVLGEGGMGRVYAARDTVLNRRVAVKVLRAAVAGQEAEARFRAEARITGQLQHPGVPPVHDLGTLADGGPFLVMKLIKGRTLAEELGDRPVPPAELPKFLTTFERVCQTVAFAHSRDVIHRDLKPQNVMVGAFGEVQVMDWGLAKVVPGHAPAVSEPPDRAETTGASEIDSGRNGCGSSDTRAGSVVGTPAYMPPEQARGEPVDRRADVFALGGILCAILTGQPPYTGTRVEVRAKAELGQVAEAADRLRACGAPADLVALAVRCLAPVSADRPGDAGAVAAAVAAFRADAEARARRAETDRARAEAHAIELRKRRRVQFALLAALALLALGGGAFAWWQDRTERDARQRRAEVEAERKQQAAETRLAIAQLRATEAETERERQRQLRAEQLTGAARAAARRGDWPTALKLYDELIAAEPGRAARFRAERLFGFFATNDEAGLRADFAALGAEPKLDPDVAAWVKLVRGAHALCDTGGSEPGRELIRAALAERARVPAVPGAPFFTPADVLYGEALLETTPRAVYTKLKAAVDADALHYPARSALIITLLASGDPRGAVKAAEEFAGLFPDSPVPAFARAARAVVDGDRAAMRREIAEFGRKARTDPNALLEYGELLADILDIMTKNAGTLQGLTVAERKALVAKMAQLQSRVAGAQKPVALPVPTVNRLLVWNLALFTKFDSLPALGGGLDPKLIPKLDADGADLAAFVADYPEALAHNLYAVNRFVGGAIAVNSDDVAGVRQRMPVAAEAAYRAADQPTLVERAPARYASLFVGIASDLTLVKLVPDAPPLHLQRLQDSLPRLIADARGQWPDNLDQCAFMFVQLATVVRTPKLLEVWATDTAVGRNLLWTREGQLYRSARYLVERWGEEIAAAPGPRGALRAIQHARARQLLDDWAAKEKLDLPAAPPPHRK